MVLCGQENNTVFFPNHTDTKLIKKLKAKEHVNSKQKIHQVYGVTPCKVSDIHRKTERLGQYLDIKIVILVNPQCLVVYFENFLIFFTMKSM